MPQVVSGVWLTAAVVVSTLVVFAAPFVGQVNLWLRDVTAGHYTLVLTAAVLLAVLAAVSAAALSIRTRAARRYGWLLAALVVGVTYAWLSRTGVREVDAAERFHFIEYGTIAMLFYKAARPAGDLSVVVASLLAGLIVGICEEWLQWFVPSRVGELRDVLLNLVAVSCGILFSIGLDSSGPLRLECGGDSRRRMAVLASAAVLAFAIFFHSVHLGYDIVDRDAGVFRSAYDAETLLRLSVERRDAWRRAPPVQLARLSREDQYLSEGIAHVRRRNQQWDEGQVLAARHENLILEKFYAPVLDTPSYASPTSSRWPLEQRAEAERRAVASPGFMIYDSDALPYTVFTWPRWMFWTGVAAIIGLVLRVVLPPHKV